MISCAVVIPCYNEQTAISGVVAAVNAMNSNTSRFLYTPIVVNDCSKDNSWSIIERLDCVGLNLPINLGIGGAVQCGFLYALRNNFQFAVQVDGDGQHPALELVKLLDVAHTEQADVVIGSRFVKKEKIGFQSSFSRRVGIAFLSNLVKLITGKRFFDITSGMRVYNSKALKIITPNYPDDFPEPVALITSLKHNLKVIETQVEMQERNGGESSIKSYKTIYYMLKVSLAMISAKFKPRVHGI